MKKIVLLVTFFSIRHTKADYALRLVSAGAKKAKSGFLNREMAALDRLPFSQTFTPPSLLHVVFEHGHGL